MNVLNNSSDVVTSAGLLENVRYMNLVSYACLSDIKIVINNHIAQIEHCSINLHDKDTHHNDNEDLKRSHYHIVLWLKYPRRVETIRKWFKHCMDENNQYANTLVQHCFDCAASFDYLTHKGDPDKYQYDESAIISFGPRSVDEYKQQKTQYKIKNEATRKREESYDRAGSIIDELVSGTPFRLMISVYGRDFIINYRHYCSAAALCCLERYDIENAKRLARYAGNTTLLQSLDFGEAPETQIDEVMQHDFDESKADDSLYGQMLGFSKYNK